MEGESTATKVHRTNGNAINQSSDNAKNSQHIRPKGMNNSQNRRNNNRNQGNANYDGTRKNAPHPKRGKRFRSKIQGQQVESSGISQVNQPPLWSNIVVKQSPHLSHSHNGHQESPQPPQQQIYEHNQKPRNRGGQKSQRKNYEQVPKDIEYDVEYNDAKIEAIQMALDKHLYAMQTKADRLKTLQEEIKAIKAERDGKIEELSNEKGALVNRVQQLKIELEATQSHIGTIDDEVERLRKEKVQKIRELEEQSRALLDDN